MREKNEEIMRKKGGSPVVQRGSKRMDRKIGPCLAKHNTKQSMRILAMMDLFRETDGFERLFEKLK